MAHALTPFCPCKDCLRSIAPDKRVNVNARKKGKSMAKISTKVVRKVIGMNTPVWFWYNPYSKKWRATVHVNAEASGEDRDEAYMHLLGKIVSGEEADEQDFNDIMSSKEK
jgi:hypothetical protein